MTQQARCGLAPIEQNLPPALHPGIHLPPRASIAHMYDIRLNVESALLSPMLFPPLKRCGAPMRRSLSCQGAFSRKAARKRCQHGGESGLQIARRALLSICSAVLWSARTARVPFTEALFAVHTIAYGCYITVFRPAQPRILVEESVSGACEGL